ncbi:hypothetical protein EON79_11820 [bacterium]|nr:MAG: hypothetical protein EON79_11820 [bacterium]
MRVFISAGEASGDAYGAVLAREIAAGFDDRAAFEVAMLNLVSLRTPKPSKHVPADYEARRVLGRQEAWQFLAFGLIEDTGPECERGDDVFLHDCWNLLPIARRSFLDIAAVGGPRLRESGVRMVASSDRWGAVGILHSLAVVPKVYGGFRAAKRELATGDPGVFIPIDFGYANIRLARRAKRLGWKVLYLVPPGSWRRDRQGKDLPEIADVAVTPFPWSAEMLQKMGLDARFYGHPIKQTFREAAPEPVERGQGVVVLPGSRDAEIAANLPVLGVALHGLKVPIEFALAPGTDAEAVLAQWAGPPATAVVGETQKALLRARVAVVCSGTATLEAVLAKTPCTVVYQGSPQMRAEEKLLTRLGLWKRPKFVALPNILLDRELVPERLDPVDPVAVRRDVDALLDDSRARMLQLAAFHDLIQSLGPDDALTKAAAVVKEMGGGVGGR